MNRHNAEIDDLLTKIRPLLIQAARSELPRDLGLTVEDLLGGIMTLWYVRYRNNPAYWWARFTADQESHIVRAAKFLARDVVREWRAVEDSEPIDLEMAEHAEALFQEIEWGKSNEDMRYENGVGSYMEGRYIACDDDVFQVFQLLARHNMTDENGTGLGRVESADLMSTFCAAKPAVAHAIRLLASGYGVGEMTNRRAYQQVASVLQVAL